MKKRLVLSIGGTASIGYCRTPCCYDDLENKRNTLYIDTKDHIHHTVDYAKVGVTTYDKISRNTNLCIMTYQSLNTITKFVFYIIFFSSEYI
jgi:hypothetical protein